MSYVIEALVDLFKVDKPGLELLNTCAKENRADVAETNGGREAGWVLMDDLIADPDTLIGELRVTICKQGLALSQ